MAEVNLEIGGRSFKIACEDGEEPSLHKAASLLDAEASYVANQLGRLPEARLLLMAGLMLADRTVGMQAREQELEAKVAELKAEIEQLGNAPTFGVKQVAVQPKGLSEMLEKIATQAEALATLTEEKAKAS